MDMNSMTQPSHASSHDVAVGNLTVPAVPLPHQVARRVFAIESDAIAKLSHLVGDSFDQAITVMIESTGRVVVTGVGKSGIIGRKIAATLASTGTPSLFMHPTEAFHGDLGMVGFGDVVIAISNSGETEEILRLLPFLRDNHNPVISITGNEDSRLAKAARCNLNAGVECEACPLRLAPTASTTAALAMGDALAVALMSARGFEPKHFARLHPGGSLGRRLLLRVADSMVTESLPRVSAHASASEIIDTISNGSLGLTIVDHSTGAGIITDGDIRRSLRSLGKDFFKITASQIMTKTPITVHPETSAHEAIEIMHESRIGSLLVAQQDAVVGVFQK